MVFAAGTLGSSPYSADPSASRAAELTGVRMTAVAPPPTARATLAGEVAEPDVRPLSVHLRAIEAAGGVVVTVDGAISDRDAALLSRSLHAQLDAEPALIVVDLSRVPSCDLTGRHVLGLARERANAAGIELQLADLGHPAPREWLVAAGLA